MLIKYICLKVKYNIEHHQLNIWNKNKLFYVAYQRPSFWRGNFCNKLSTIEGLEYLKNFKVKQILVYRGPWGAMLHFFWILYNLS